MKMNESRRPCTYTLARLYEAQGHAGRAVEIYKKLQAEANKNTGDEKQFPGPGYESENARSEGLAGLALIMGQWIDLLRRRRFFESKS